MNIEFFFVSMKNCNTYGDFDDSGRQIMENSSLTTEPLRQVKVYVGFQNIRNSLKLNTTHTSSHLKKMSLATYTDLWSISQKFQQCLFGC